MNVIRQVFKKAEMFKGYAGLQYSSHLEFIDLNAESADISMMMMPKSCWFE